MTTEQDTLEKGWMTEQTATPLYEEFLSQRAVQAYTLTNSALNMIGMRDGSEAKFGAGYNVLPVWKERMDGETLVPTPNCDVIYSMSYLDLKKDGPLVVYAPPGVIGMFDDFFQRPITDVGLSGPDNGQGGLYLLLPPDYQGHVPGGYYVFRSRTYNVFLFWRNILTPGDDGPDTTQGVAQAEQTLIYKLGSFEKDRPTMQFPNAPFVPVNMLAPTGFTYWEKLKEFVDYEPVECMAPEVRGMLASIGIIKGEPFDLDGRQKEILTRAAELAPQMILAQRAMKGTFEKIRYYNDRQWFNVFSGIDAEFMTNTYLDLDVRAAYFQFAYSVAPAMLNDTVDKGAKYPAAMHDADGELLTGERTYRLHLPPDVPAALYWALTVYNPKDGTMPITDQKFPSINALNKPQYNEDGSIDIYFGPEKPGEVHERNWLQTMPDHVWLVGLRLYGTKASFYTQKWKPDDIVRIE